MSDKQLKIIGLSVIPLMREMEGSLYLPEMKSAIRRTRIRKILRYLEKVRYHLDELVYHLNMPHATEHEKKICFGIFYGREAGTLPPNAVELFKSSDRQTEH